MSTSEPKADGTAPLPYAFDGPRESPFATPVAAQSGLKAGYPSEAAGPGLPPTAAGVPQSYGAVPALSMTPTYGVMPTGAGVPLETSGASAGPALGAASGAGAPVRAAPAQMPSAPAAPAMPASAFGLPDLQLMAAWANEFFKGPGAAATDPAALAPLSGASVPREPPALSAAPAAGSGSPQLPFAAEHPGFHVPAQLPVASPIPQAPPIGPDPSQAGFYFLDQTQGRQFVPVNPEPYTRPLTMTTGPVPKAGAFFAQPMTAPSGVPPTAAALAHGVPLAANSGALPIMAGSAEPAWSVAQPALGEAFPIGPLGTPMPGIGAGVPASPYGGAGMPNMSGADFAGLSGGGFPISLPGFGSDFGAAPQTGFGLPATAGGTAPPSAASRAEPSSALGAPAYPNGGFGAPTGVPTAAATVPNVPAGGSVPENSERVAAQSGARIYEFQPTFLPEEQGRRLYDVDSIRRDFPILREFVHGKPLVWLDNAATTQKPQSVIDRISFFYEHENSNIHRAAHSLAARSTDAYENAREASRRFLNAPSAQDIIFVRGTTEAVNLVAQSWGKRNLQAGDEIVITWVEHHSNIVPWQQLCAETGARLKVAPVDDDGQILLNEYERLFSSRTKLASFTQVSNALGTILPVKEMTEIAHRHGARVMVDGAQAVSHMRVDVQALDCDFYAFSGHKVFGPTGIGVLYGKSDLLQSMPPWQGGGSMIVDVMFDKTVYAQPPTRFEAGTGNIADAVGLGAAIEYVERIGMDNIARHEHELLEYGTAKLLTVPRLRLIGTAKEKAGVMGFVIDGVPTESVGAALSKEGIAVRAGHHCAQPALRRFGLESTVRPSLALYNNKADVDKLVATLLTLQSNYR
ncbi:MAG TPA: family 2A encapsulin nanocompartment cargo protein cysteine desulfurase [Polyangiales bacterium]|nr:family 2A encapsulin nanocompartment cargo protein cysteine desulfurase [Polyangiales bacterium]